MLGMKEMVTFAIVSLLVVLSVSWADDGIRDLYESLVERDNAEIDSRQLRRQSAEDKWSYNEVPPFDRRLQYLLETKRSVTGIKNLIDELQTRLEKRTACALDGGLSASCNHKDAVEAGEHHRFLASSFAPGRRKRRSLQPFPVNYDVKN